MGFSLSKAWKSVKGAVKDAGRDIEKAGKKNLKYMAPGVKPLFDNLTGKTAMKAQQAQMNAEAAQAEQQARVAAEENRDQAFAVANSAAAGEARQRMVNQEAIANAGAPQGEVDIDIEEGALADPARRRRYTPGSGMPLTV